MSQEFVFPDVGKKISEFMDEMVENLQEEGLDPQKTTQDDEIHIKVQNSFFSRGAIISREDEGDLRTMFKRRGGKLSLGIILGAMLTILGISFFSGVSYLAFIAVVPACLGQILISRKLTALSQKIQRSLEETIQSFPELKEKLEKKFEKEQSSTKEEDTNFTCPECEKDFLVPELVSLHLERKHNITWRELTEDDFEKGTLKEEIRKTIKEEQEDEPQ